LYRFPDLFLAHLPAFSILEEFLNENMKYSDGHNLMTIFPIAESRTDRSSLAQLLRFFLRQSLVPLRGSRALPRCARTVLDGGCAELARRFNPLSHSPCLPYPADWSLGIRR
jgi:hypothetical protein